MYQMIRSYFITLAVTIAVPIASIQASAALTTFSDRSAWEAAVASFQTETFNMPDTGPLDPDITHTLGLIDFSYTGSSEFSFVARILGNRFFGNPYVPTFGGGTTEPGVHVFTLPNSVTALGADFINTDIVSLTIGPDTVNIPAAPQFDTPFFFGVISDAPFDSFIIDAIPGQPQINDNFLMDDLSFGDAATSLQGDLDGDGFVGINDLNIVLGNWNQNVPPGNPLADPSGDGFVGIDDLGTVLGNWNAGAPPAPASVPEPASAVLLGLGALALIRRRD